MMGEFPFHLFGKVKKLRTDLDAHTALTNPHSAVSTATASRLILRDANGRAQVVDPAVNADIATRGWVLAQGFGTGGGTVSSVGSGTGLTGGPIITTGTLSLANTAVTAGTYTYATLTVDAQGRLTAASSGVNPLNASNLSAGTVPTARLGTGTANNTKYLRGDNTWQTFQFSALSGTVSNAQVPSGAVTQHQSLFAINGNQIVTDVTSQTASFSVASSMDEEIVLCDSASIINITVGNNALGGAAISAVFIRRGIGAVNFVASGVTIRSPGGLSIAVQHGKAVLTQIDATNFELCGGV